jgi:hypothetical protein
MHLRTATITAVVWLSAPVLLAAAQQAVAPAAPSLTCDEAKLVPDSYRLTTEAEALILTAKRTAWWDNFIVNRHLEAAWDLHTEAAWAAEQALRLDPANRLAWSILAREYVVLGEELERAEQAWRATLDASGAVVWTATIYDVDPKSYFVVAFDRQGFRIYRFGAFVGKVERKLGVPQFPGPEKVALWRALGGCIDAGAEPEAVVPWSDVKEIEVGHWVLWIKLADKIKVRADSGDEEPLGKLKVAFHGQPGSVELHVHNESTDPRKATVTGVGLGPVDYQERLRWFLVRFFDPEGRISLPKPPGRGAGW